MTSLPVLDVAAPEQPPGLAGIAQRLLNPLNNLMAVLSAIAIAVAGGVLTWEVIGRYFLGIASDWQDELATFLLVGATFASAAWTQARRGHVGIDALAQVLPRWADDIRRRLADGIALAFCAFFAWKSWTLLLEALEDGQTTPSAWGPPLWIPYSCMTIGMGLLSLQLAIQCLSRSVVHAVPPAASGDHALAGRMINAFPPAASGDHAPGPRHS